MAPVVTRLFLAASSLVLTLMSAPGLSNDTGAKAPIQYRISFRQAETHRIDIEVHIPTDGLDRIELFLPVWTPGSYLVREYSRQIETMTAHHGLSNEPMPLERVSKNRWALQTTGAPEVNVRYTVYCREMSVRTNWVEKDFAFLTGAATFLTRDDCQDRSHIIKLDPLPQWKQIATSLLPAENDTWTRIATSFDDLVDSPIVMGELDIRSFECGGVPHYLATLGGDKFWDSEKALGDVQKIVAKEQEFWGEVPYKAYWFLNLATEQGGGLEHDNSTVLMTSRFATKDKAKYQNWLGLVSHEFFHTWNVRRLRPKALVNYDYDREQYFRELWVAEGITSYYDDLFLPRAGVCTPAEYLDRLNKTVADVQKSPGRKVQSLFDSSFDAWTKYYRPDENAKNSRVSYYTKGSLVGLLLDVEIRRATNNAKSLDDVMRKLWSDHRSTGYTNEDVVRICNEISSQDLQPWFKDCLETTKELNFQPLMDFYGLEWKDATTKDGNATEPAFVGLTLNNQSGKAMIATVPTDTPAADAGFNVGDEWIGLNNLRITAENWNEMVGYFRPGDECECLIARHGKLVTLKLTLGTKPRESWTLKRVEKPSDQQEANWNSWLGIKPEAKVTPDVPAEKK